MKINKITQKDYSKISRMINYEKRRKREELWNLVIMKTEFSQAEKVDPRDISPEFVTMNSIVEVVDLDTNRSRTLRIVYPDASDLKQGDISVFSNLGRVLIGCREGAVISYEGSVCRRKAKLLRVIYQPEANGVFTN